jgi:hypothetical protein
MSAIGAASRNLRGQAVLQPPCHWPPDDRHTAKPAASSNPHDAYTASRRPVMAVMLSDKGIRRA